MPYRPIGSRQIQLCGHIEYWLIKVEDPSVWEYEHRKVMAEKLGRPLRLGEVVHHINHNSLDNDPDNLELLTKGEHTKLHLTLPKGRWAKDFERCRECGTSEKKHISFGLCSTCYQRLPGKSWKDKHATK